MYQWQKFENKWMRIQMLDTLLTAVLFFGLAWAVALWKGWV